MARFLADWSVYQDIYSDPEMEQAAGEPACLRAWLAFEQAVTAARAGEGLVAAEHARAIEAVTLEELDLEGMPQETARVGRPIVPFLERVRRVLPGEAGTSLHAGLTTQDVMDTGHAILARDGCALIDRRLGGLLGLLRRTAAAHATTPMLGRTNAMAARPTTFGFRCATWLAEMTRHRKRVLDAAREVATIQLGGAVGTLAGFGGRGRSVREKAAARLGLAVPEIAHHPTRDRTVHLLLVLAGLGASVRRIAADLSFLAGSGIEEVAFRQPAGAGISSTMAHKRNPRCVEMAEACAGLAASRGATAIDAAAHRADREGGTWLREWPTLVEVLHYGAVGLRELHTAFDTLEVETGRMAANLAAVPEVDDGADHIEAAAAEVRAVLGALTGE